MKLIAGLGNPGTRYADTRHNIGFCVIEELVKRHGAKIKKKLFGKAGEAHLRISGVRSVVIEPLTYMNLSGRCLLRYVKRFNISPEELLVVCDDINLPLGRVRIRMAGTSGGHNGLESVIESLNTKDFPRLRIGVRAPGDVIRDMPEYVLSNFSKDDKARIGEAVLSAADCCECWVKDGIDKAMNIYNRQGG